MEGVPVWKWLLAAFFVAGSAFCSGTETAFTALGDARARQLREQGGRRASLLGLWVDHPERVLSTLLIGNTLVNVGAGALAAALAIDIAAWTAMAVGTSVALATVGMTAAVLFAGEILPKTVAKRHPVRIALASIPVVHALCFVLWPLSAAVTRATSRLLRLLGVGPGQGVTGEEIEYLIEIGTREGALDPVKEELLNSVLEFADRVAREIMVPRTRMVAIERDLPADELVRVITENPFSRMPVYRGTMDEIAGILIVREIVGELRHGGRIDLGRHLKPAFFVPEGMKISRLLKEMQRRRTHLAIVVDEFGGTSGLVTLEDVLEEIVGEIQDEADGAEAAPVKEIAPGVWLADASVPLHDLEAFLNRRPEAGAEPLPEILFPESGDYETLGGLVTATAGRVPQVGASVRFGDLTLTVRAGDERRVARVEIARPGAAGPPVSPPVARASGAS